MAEGGSTADGATRVAGDPEWLRRRPDGSIDPKCIPVSPDPRNTITCSLEQPETIRAASAPEPCPPRG